MLDSGPGYNVGYGDGHVAWETEWNEQLIAPMNVGTAYYYPGR